VSNPFGAAPEDEVFNLKTPEAKDDPYGPIGAVDPETEVYLTPDKPARAECLGKCTSVKQDVGPSGPMLVFDFVATEGRFAGRDFTTYVSFSDKARFKVVETKQAFGTKINEFFTRNNCVGVYVILCLQDELFDGRWSAKLRGTKAHPKGAGFRGANLLP